MAFRSLRHTLTALLLLLSLTTGAAAAVQVRVMPVSATGAVGSTITVTVEADSITDLGGFQFGFVYSTADLQALSATVNPVFDQAVAQDLGAATGSGLIAATVFTNPPLSGAPVTLATIDFRIVTPVAGPISLANVVLGQVGGAEIPSLAVGGTVGGYVTSIVSFASGGNGTLTGSASQTVTYGGSTTAVTAVPAPGYHFVKWTEGATVAGTTAALTVSSVIAAHNYTANFAADQTDGVCGSSNGGTFSGAPTISLCSTGTPSAVTGSGSWSWTCSGSSGGTTAPCSAAVDMTGPALTVSTLADGAVTNNATLNVSGTVADAGGVAGLTVNNAAVTVTSGSFSYAVALQAGPNSITITATDALGNSTTDTRTVTLDTTAPALTVSVPADNSTTAHGVATITGTVNKTSTVTVAISSSTPQSAAITENVYSATVNLVVGLNSIIITVADLAGNTTGAVRTVTYDNTNPSLAITDPNQDVTTAQNSIAISGTVSDTVTTATVALTFDNQTYSPAITVGAFSQLLTIPAEGAYAVTATATDEAGNSSSVTRNVIYAVPVSGACGNSNGGSFSSAPTADLCNSGPATAVTGSGPWNWSCGGTNGGSPAPCSAGTQISTVDTVPPDIITFTIPATATTRAVAVTDFTATDNVGVTGYLISNSAAVPAASDPSWTTAAPASYSCSSWGNHTLYAYAKDAAGNISDATSATVYIGIKAGADGVILPAPTKTEPHLFDALKSLDFALKVEIPTAAEKLHGDVAPLVNGIPQPDGEMNLGDTIVILRRVVGL